MATAAKASPAPQTSNFIGELHNQRLWKRLSMAEVVHEKPISVPKHEHSLAYFTLVLGGAYEEEGKKGFVSFAPMSAMFHPQGTRHTGKIGSPGARFFTVEVERPWFEPFRSMDFESHVTENGRLAWLMVQLFRNYRTAAPRANDADLLTTESLMWEMLAETASGVQRDVRFAPEWIARAQQMICDAGAESVAMEDIAEAVNVHPVYFARAFRKFVGMTAGEYLRTVRVRRACEKLLARNYSLAGVAADCGFADQSHMTRVFRELTKTTPAEFRKLLM